MGGLTIAGAAAAALGLVFAVDARSQTLPGGSIPYQTNSHTDYRTNAPVIGQAHSGTGAIHAPSFGCARSPMGTQAVRNPGTAGPAFTGNYNNCSRAAPAGAVVIGPH